MVFTDQNGNLLPHGTVVAAGIHQGVVGYLPTGQQAAIHKSKKYGKPVLTLPEEVNDGILPIRIVRLPRDEWDGMRVWNNALNELHRGGPWTIGDNCEDLVSRATTGQNGSPTRNGFLLAGIAAFLFWRFS